MESLGFYSISSPYQGVVTWCRSFDSLLDGKMSIQLNLENEEKPDCGAVLQLAMAEAFTCGQKHRATAIKALIG